MKKAVSLVFVILLLLSACGSGAADRMARENEALRERIAALEERNTALQKQLEDAEEKNVALQAETGRLQRGENPIDPFYDAVDSNGATVVMSTVSAARADAWETETRNVAEHLKEQLPLQEDRALVDAYIAAAEEQVERIYVMVFYSVSDVQRPHSERLEVAGTLWSVLWGERRADIWRDTFYELFWVLPDSGCGPDYTFIFDPEKSVLDTGLQEESLLSPRQ